nr:Arm DNA-binding domain-containing protein [Streptomyces marianii]
MTGSTYKRCKCPATYDDKGRRKNCRKDHGAWYYVADVGFGPDGKRKQVRKGGFRTADDAEKELAELLGRVNNGSYTHDEGQTIATWLGTWLELKERAGLRPSTLRAYRSHIDEYLVPQLGRLRLRDLRPQHVDQLLTTLDNGKRKAATTRRIHATLRSALSTAVRRRLVTFNAAKDVDLPTAQRPKVKPWEPEELGQFLDSIGTHRLGALFEVIAGTGLRRGEAVGLRWDDVDLARRVIVVRQQVVQESGRKKNKQAPAACPYCEAGHLGMSFGKPKTASGEDRVIDLDEVNVGALLSHKLRQDDERRAWGVAYQAHGLLFAREDGNPLRPDDVTKLFVALVELRACAGCGCTTCATVRHPSWSRPAWTWRSCPSDSATPRSRSRRTPTRICWEASGGTLRTAPRPSFRAPGRPPSLRLPTTSVTTR